jgi:hypothetical protein
MANAWNNSAVVRRTLTHIAARVADFHSKDRAAMVGSCDSTPRVACGKPPRARDARGLRCVV